MSQMAALSNLMTETNQIPSTSDKTTGELKSINMKKMLFIVFLFYTKR